MGCGPERRSLAGRFLLAQFCGNSLVMLGFAMLVVGVPWMKMEDSSTLPDISWNIVNLVDQIQRWTDRSEFAFQYENDVFPWILLVLSLGFAIQFGLFPIHSWQVSVLGDQCPRAIAVLCLAGNRVDRNCRLAEVRPPLVSRVARGTRLADLGSVAGRRDLGRDPSFGSRHATAASGILVPEPLGGIAVGIAISFTGIGLIGNLVDAATGDPRNSVRLCLSSIRLA